jgi:hypothetical protein
LIEMSIEDQASGCRCIVEPKSTNKISPAEQDLLYGGPPRGECTTPEDANAQFWEDWVDEIARRCEEEEKARKSLTSI